jgi:hypothetical protein
MAQPSINERDIISKARSPVAIYRRWRQSDSHGLFGIPRPRGTS